MSAEKHSSPSDASKTRQDQLENTQEQEPDQTGQVIKVVGASTIERARLKPSNLTPADVRQLQPVLGNRAIGRLLQKAQVERQAAVPVQPAAAIPPAQATVQRTEADAVKRANKLHPGGKYQNWGQVRAAKDLPVRPIAKNWKSIYKAYLKEPKGSRKLEDLYAEADRLTTIDARHWSEPQARREAEAVLNQLVEWQAKLKKKGEIFARPALALRIKAIQEHFLMPIRSMKAKGRAARKPGAKGQTSLDMPTGGSLDLWNKINPATNQPQGLGAGGMGYGRHGMFTDDEGNQEQVFVKKQKMKKSEALAEQAFGKSLYDTPAGVQDQYLGFIQEEHEKFKNEMTIALQLDHENVVKTYGGAISVGKGGQEKAYMMLEVLSTDLRKLIAGGAMSEPTKLNIMKGALAGLAHVHGNRIIHRDIKPENIMMDGAGVPKLIDFGEAVTLANGADSFNTRTKAGTMGYYHPDKIVRADAERRDLTYDKSTDLYALKKSFEEMHATTAGIDAWLASFDAIDDAGQLKATLEGLMAPPVVADVEDDEAVVEAQEEEAQEELVEV